jgi:hypothetical protein
MIIWEGEKCGVQSRKDVFKGENNENKIKLEEEL